MARVKSFRRWASLSWCCVAGVWVCVTPLWPQQAPPAPALKPRTEQRPDAQPAGQVILDVSAMTLQGPAQGLTAPDFRVADNGDPVRFTLQPGGPGPPDELVFVLDAVNCSFEDLAAARDSVLHSLRANAGHLPVPVQIILLDASSRKTDREARNGMFTLPLGGKTGSMRVIVSSQDGMALAARLEAQPLARSGVLDAQGSHGDETRVQLSLQAVNVLADAERVRPGHKLVVWLGPGWQRLTFNQTQRRKMADYIAYVTAGLRAGRVTLVQVDPSAITSGFSPDSAGGVGHREYTGPLGNFAADLADAPLPVAPETFVNATGARIVAPSANALTIQSLVVNSGGAICGHSNDIQKSLHACLSMLDSFYAVVFPAPKTTRPLEFHAIHVAVAQPGVTLRYPDGYYATAAPEAQVSAATVQ